MKMNTEHWHAGKRHPHNIGPLFKIISSWLSMFYFYMYVYEKMITNSNKTNLNLIKEATARSFEK